MKVKIINEAYTQNLENEINKFFDENKDIKIHSTTLTPKYYKDYYSDGSICNQYMKYIMTIIYELNK